MDVAKFPSIPSMYAPPIPVAVVPAS